MQNFFLSYKSLICKCTLTYVSLFFFQLGADQAEAVSVSNQLATKLYSHIKGEKGNFVCSPFSVTSDLVIAYLAAKGDTQKELQTVLRLSGDNAKILKSFGDLYKFIDDSWQVTLGESFWVQSNSGSVQDFNHLVASSFGNVAREVDFASRQDYSREQINKWLSEVTKGKIDSIFQAGSISPTTKFISASMLYFQDNWGTPFPVDETKDKPFNINNFVSRSVPTMHKTALLKYAGGEFFDMVEIPFSKPTSPSKDKASEFSFLLILPKKGKFLATVENEIDIAKLVDISKNATPALIKLALPRFHLTDHIFLNAPLQAIGLQLLFTSHANLSGLVYEGSFINNLVNISLISVNEQGVELNNAVSSQEEELPDSQEPPMDVKANQPFIFLILEKSTGLILLMGRISEP